MTLTNPEALTRVKDLAALKDYCDEHYTGSGGDYRGTILVNLEAYANDTKTAGTDLNGLTVSLLDTETSTLIASQTWQGQTLTFSGLSPMKGYTISVQTHDTYTLAAATQAVATLGLGETVTKTFQYKADQYTVAITSNQTADTAITAARVTALGTQYADGATFLVPQGTAITPTASDITGYAKTVTTSGKVITAAYKTMKLTVALASDTGKADLSGVTKTVTDTTDSVTLTAQQDGTYKVPSGHAYSVSVSDVDGYSTPAAQTGTATGTADAAATVTMTYEEAAGFVDLGLPSGTKWATGNIVKNGSKYEIGDETAYGAYVSWGNVEPHFSSDGSSFDDGYDWGESNEGPYAETPGAEISGLSLGESFSETSGYDAARELLGGAWKMPTMQQFKELYDNCNSVWESDHNGSGVAGRLFTSKLNGKSVFFPAAGYGYGSSLNNRGSYGFYWSRSWYSSDRGYLLRFLSSLVLPQYDLNRYRGFSVRAVQ